MHQERLLKALLPFCEEVYCPRIFITRVTWQMKDQRQHRQLLDPFLTGTKIHLHLGP